MFEEDENEDDLSSEASDIDDDDDDRTSETTQGTEIEQRKSALTSQSSTIDSAAETDPRRAQRASQSSITVSPNQSSSNLYSPAECVDQSKALKDRENEQEKGLEGEEDSSSRQKIRVTNASVDR